MQPNLIYINELSVGDDSFKSHLICVLKKEFSSEASDYFCSMLSNNFKQALVNVDKLKHKIIILGLENGYETASGFEDSLIENKTCGQEEFESILETIGSFLNRI